MQAHTYSRRIAGAQTVLHTIEKLFRYEILATDGKVGRVSDAYFDDEKWVVRYLVVDTGGWLSGRSVLISPFAVKLIDRKARTIATDLARLQIEGAPDIDTAKPVSRQQEMEYHRYYGYPEYWSFSTFWPLGAAPVLIPPEPEILVQQEQEQQQRGAETTSDDPHLRSSREVIGYRIRAVDDSIGHVEDFLFDDETWAIRYLIVDTRNWLPGRRVLVAPSWVREINWNEGAVSVDLNRAAIEHSPKYDPEHLPSRAYEEALHRHYSRPGYWA
jgi:sporulation protein YlmC with PRC-barrel domain